MATGDQNDIVGRLKALLPRWFSDSASLLSATLQGYASAAAFVYSLYAYAKQQTRIATATDGWLDMIAGDFFGSGLPRKAGQSDGSYRTSIQINLLRERGTRPGLEKVVQDITGIKPTVVEPMRALDTGGYGIRCGYGVAGAYRPAVAMPYVTFVKVYRPTVASGLSVSDADIYAAIDAVRPAGTVAWVCILSPLDTTFVLDQSTLA